MQTIDREIRSELDEKIERVRAAMRSSGIGTLAVYYGGQHNASRLDPVFWLTEARVLGPAMAIVPLSGRPSLLLSQSWDVARASASAHVADVRGSSRSDLIADAVALLRDVPAPVALAGRTTMPISVYEEFAQRLGCEPPAADDLIPALADVRTASELARVERAAQIADEGFRTLCSIARAGMREYELAAEVDAAMSAAGAEDNFGLIGAGQSNVTIRPPSDRRLERGDVVMCEITPAYKGYLAQLCRTFVLGKPTDAQSKTYDLLMTAERAGLAAAVPGNAVSAIAKAINEVIGGAGYEEYCKPPYMRSRGHGLGTGGVAPLDINESTKTVLKPGMTMVIHPNQFVPASGYMMCGDMVVIEEHGPRLLTRTPLRLFSAEAA